MKQVRTVGVLILLITVGCLPAKRRPPVYLDGNNGADTFVDTAQTDGLIDLSVAPDKAIEPDRASKPDTGGDLSTEQDLAVDSGIEQDISPDANAQPDTQGDLATPDLAEDNSTPDTRSPNDQSTSDQTSADTQADQPGDATSETANPDTSTLDTSSSDTNTADTNTPDTNTADTNTPDTSTPDTNTADTNTPDTNTADTNTPDTNVDPCAGTTCPLDFVCQLVDQKPECVCSKDKCGGCETAGRDCLQGEICGNDSKCACPNGSGYDPNKHNVCAANGYVCGALGSPCPPGFSCDATTGACICDNASCGGCETAGRDCLLNEGCKKVNGKRRCVCGSDLSYDSSKVDSCTGDRYVCGGDELSCGNEFICSNGGCLCSLPDCTDGCNESCRKNETCNAKNQCSCGNNPGCGLFGEQMDCTNGKCQCGNIGRPCPNGFLCTTGACVCVGDTSSGGCEPVLDWFKYVQKLDERFVIVGNYQSVGIFNVQTGNVKAISRFDDNLNIKAIWAASTTEIYAVSNKHVYRLKGNSWQLMHTASQNLYGIWGSTKDNIIVAGSNGYVAHYKDGTWQPVDLSTTEFLNLVWGSEANDIYVLSSSGKAFHFDGLAWKPTIIGDVSGFKAITGTSKDDVLVLGHKNGDSKLFLFDGKDWSPVVLTDARMNQIDAIELSAAGDILGAALCPTDKICVFRRRNEEWITVGEVEKSGLCCQIVGLAASNDSNITVIHERFISGFVKSGLEPNPTWTATDVLLRFNPMTISGNSITNLVSLPNFNPSLEHPIVGRFDGIRWKTLVVDIVAENLFQMHDIWGMGQIIWLASQQPGIMFRHDGQKWVSHSLPNPGTIVTKLWGTSETGLYGVGTTADGQGGDRGILLKFDGNKWSEIDTGIVNPTDFTYIWGSGPSDIYILSYSGMYHYSGATWDKVNATATANLWKIWGTGASDVWAIGSEFWRDDGTGWKKVTLPDGAIPGDIHGSGPNDIVVRSDKGLYYWNGSQWSGPTHPDLGQGLIWVDKDFILVDDIFIKR